MQRELIERMAESPAEFRRHLLIDCGGEPRKLAAAAADFQRRDFEALDGAWQAVAGLPVPEPRYRRGWCERTRGSSKTGDAAVQALWLLAFSRRQVAGVVVAADADQAAIIRQAIERLLGLNGWLSPLVECQRWEVRNPTTGSTLRIMASDEKSSWGLLIDFAIIEEASAHPTDAMFVSILSAIAKKRNTVLLVIGNAGWRLSWCFKVREQIMADERWYFSAQSGPADWISEQDLAEQKRLLPPASYKRLWENVWSAQQGDAFTEAQVERLVEFNTPMVWREQYNGFAVGVDVGLERHHSAVATLAIDQKRQVVRVASIRDFAPPVTLQHVYDEIMRQRAQFNASYLFYDPHQCASIAQACQRAGMAIEMVHPTLVNLSRQAVALTEAIRDRRLLLYRDGSRDAELLIEDLLSCQIVERPQGYKIELGESPTSGHGDRLSSVLQALPDCLGASGLPIADRRGDMAYVHGCPVPIRDGMSILQFDDMAERYENKLDGLLGW